MIEQGPKPVTPGPVAPSDAIETIGGSTAVTTGKSLEDYLIGFETRLLSILSDLQKAANVDLAAIYGLAFLLALLKAGLVTELPVAGAKVTLSPHQLFQVVSALGLFINLLLIYELTRISDIIRRLSQNSRELQSLNPVARPIKAADLYLFGLGPTGLILSLARRFARSIIRKHPFTKQTADDVINVLQDLFVSLVGVVGAPVNPLALSPASLVRVVRVSYTLGNWSFRLLVLLFIIIVVLAGSMLLPLSLLLADGVVANWIIDPWDWPIIVASALVFIGLATASTLLLVIYLEDILEPLIDAFSTLQTAASVGVEATATALTHFKSVATLLNSQLTGRD